jgi:hypothetical protein
MFRRAIFFAHTFSTTSRKETNPIFESTIAEIFAGSVAAEVAQKAAR